jgi:hypothetical protein
MQDIHVKKKFTRTLSYFNSSNDTTLSLLQWGLPNRSIAIGVEKLEGGFVQGIRYTQVPWRKTHIWITMKKLQGRKLTDSELVIATRCQPSRYLVLTGRVATGVPYLVMRRKKTRRRLVLTEKTPNFKFLAMCMIQLMQSGEWGNFGFRGGGVTVHCICQSIHRR